MGVAELIGVIALGVALVALWLSSDSAQRITRYLEKKLNARVDPLRELQAENRQMMNTLLKQVTEIDKRLKLIEDARAADAETTASLQKNLGDLQIKIQAAAAAQQNVRRPSRMQ